MSNSRHTHTLWRGPLCMALCAALCAACSSKSDDIFSDSAAIRLQKAVAEYTDLLESNAYGWAMDYYTGTGIEGGIAYTARFSDGAVTLSCERPIDYTSVDSRLNYKYSAGQEAESAYSVKSENSVQLSFDTFNALIHYWTQPFGIDSDGFAGDYEFTFVHASPDSVVLRGKKYGRLMRLYPLRQPASEYIAQVVAMRDKLSAIPRKHLVADGQSLSVSCMDNHLQYTDGDTRRDLPYTYTDTGIRLYQPISVNGIEAQRLDYDEATRDLTSPDGRMRMPYPTLVEQFTGTVTQWYLGYTQGNTPTDMCDALAALVTDCANGFKKRDWGYEVLSAIYIGGNLQDAATSSHPQVLGWVVRDNYGRGSFSYFGYAVTMDTEDDAQRLISVTPVEATSGFGLRSALCQPIVDWMAANSPFTLTFDTDESPTTVTLTSRQDSGSWLTLSRR